MICCSLASQASKQQPLSSFLRYCLDLDLKRLGHHAKPYPLSLSFCSAVSPCLYYCCTAHQALAALHSLCTEGCARTVRSTCVGVRNVIREFIWTAATVLFAQVRTGFFDAYCTLLTLYKTLVLPHLSYCSAVWDPPASSCNASSLDKVQKFALRMCCKEWSLDYPSLLLSARLPSPVLRRRNSKLLLMYKFLNHHIYLPPNLIHRAIRPSRHFHPLNLDIQFCHTSFAQSSFAVDGSKAWNSLSPAIKSAPSLFSFKRSVRF